MKFLDVPRDPLSPSVRLLIMVNSFPFQTFQEENKKMTKVVPFPPTDNLYKFKAIGGCILLGMGILISAYSKHQRISAGIAEVHKIDELQEVYVRLMIEHGNVDKAFFGDVPLLFDTIRENKQKARESEMKLLDNLHKEYHWTMGLFMLLGCYFSATGFREWGSKVQKYQDQILKAEAERVLNQNSKNSDSKE